MKVEISVYASHGVTVDTEREPHGDVTRVEFDVPNVAPIGQMGFPIMIVVYDDEGRQLIVPVGIDIGPRGGVRLVR